MVGRTHQVKSFFDRLSYLTNSRDRIWIRIQIVKMFLQDAELGSVLDVGCGDGSLSLSLISKCDRLVLNDLSEKMLEQARMAAWKSECIEKVEFLLGDLASIELEDNAFDVIICVGVLAHVDSPVQLLVDLNRACKPRGYIILETTPNPRIAGNSLRRVFGLKSVADPDYVAYKKNRLSVESLGDHARSFGWVKLEEQRFSLPFIAFGRLPLIFRCVYTWCTWKLPFLSRFGQEFILLYQKG